MTRAPLAGLAVLLAWTLAASVAHAEEPVVGKHHPELRLPRIDDGELVSLAAQRGTKVLLIQFASW